MKRVYVHIEAAGSEGAGSGSRTEAMDLHPETATPRALIQEVMRRRHSPHAASTGREAAGFRLRFEAAEEGEEVRLRSPRDWDAPIFDLVENKADLFLSIDLSSSTPVTAAAPVVAAPTSAPAPAAAPVLPPVIPPAVKAAPAVVKAAAAAAKKFDISLAEQLLKSRKLRKLREMCEEACGAGVLNAAGGSTSGPIDEATADPVVFIWKLRMENEQFEEAVAVSARLCALRPRDWVSWTTRGAALSSLRDDTGGAREEEALECFNKAVGLMKAESKPAASSVLARIAGFVAVDPALGAASSLFRLQLHTQAADVLNDIIARGAEAETHVPVLTLYARICLVYRKWSECIQSVLKAVITPGASKRALREAKHLLVQALAAPAGFEELRRQLVAGPATAPAYAFLGVTAKDESQFDLALRLLGIAAEQVPSNCNYAVAITHIHEAKGQPMKAFQWVRDFCARNHSLCVNVRPVSDSSGEVHFVGMKCGDFAKLLDEHVLCAGSTGKSSDGTKLFLSWEREIDTVPAGAVSGAVPYSMHSGTGHDGYVSVVSLTADGVVRVLDEGEDGAGAAATTSTNADDDSYANITLASEDASLDILAIAFTVVKLLFTSGRLECIPHFARLVEPTRVALQKQGQKSIHETHIRNEHAYYLCVVQIVASHSSMYLAAVESRMAEAAAAAATSATEAPSTSASASPSPLEGLYCWLRDRRDPALPAAASASGPSAAAGGVVYVCGDSHCLSSAWCDLTPDSSYGSGITSGTGAGAAAARPVFTLVPKLVTGLKHWHLRPESDFYPKEIFNLTCASIPDGSTLVFLVGEIDCREGMLRALERDLYGSSLETAARTSCTIFARAVLNLLKYKPRLKVHLLHAHICAC